MPGNILGSVDAGSAPGVSTIVDARDIALFLLGNFCNPSMSVVDLVAGTRLLWAGGMLSATCSK